MQRREQEERKEWIRKEWIGVDLDRTLAYFDYNRWKIDKHYIGEPIREILERTKMVIKQGKRVKIFTARASNGEDTEYIRTWLKKNGLPGDLEITNIKDFDMIELWDDIVKQVIPNSGIFIEDIVNGLIHERKIIKKTS